jgi:hypothetical protein
MRDREAAGRGSAVCSPWNGAHGEGPDAFRRANASEIDRVTDVVESAGIRPE